MRRIPKEFENPIDNLFIALCENNSQFYKDLNMTPNHITSLSLIVGLLACYFFWLDHYVISALLYVLSYYYDCMDGYFARKYKMTSKFGDIYDHVCDYVKTGLLLYLMYLKNSQKLFYLTPIILLNGILMFVHIDCQEKIIPKSEESIMMKTTSLSCPGTPEKTIRYTKYFGCGTAIAIMTAGILSYAIK